jgi:hypothetical protein
MELMRCPRCEKEIPDVSRFCRRCGCALSRYGSVGAAAAVVMTMPVARAAPALSWPAGMSAASPAHTAAKKTTGSGRGAFVLLGVMGTGLAFRTLVAPQAVSRPEPVLEYRTSVIEATPRYSNWGGTRVVLPPNPPAPPHTATDAYGNAVPARGHKVAR